MTLIEKLKAAQGDNAELCHVAAEALEQLSTGTCVHCKWGNIPEKDGCVDEGCWDYEGNNDSIQPHIEAPKKRKLMSHECSRSKVVPFINFNYIKQEDIQAIKLSGQAGEWATVWYWVDS